MKLDAFIQHNLEVITDEWEFHARDVGPPANPTMAVPDLRSRAQELLAQIARDMQRGRGADGVTQASQSGIDSDAADDAALAYAASRHVAGFSNGQVIRELCLLRSIVSSLWRQAESRAGSSEAVDGLDRFHGALDDAISRSVESYTNRVAASRDLFLAVLGHDLRSPLHGIAMASSVLASPDLSKSTRVETAKRVMRAAKIMDGLIADLLDFTRTRLGVGMRIERSDCDLREACEEAIEMVRMSAPQREFIHTFSGDLRMRADRSRIREVLSNVLNNAIQHGDENAPVSLTAVGAEDAILLTVSNVGKAISGEAARMIFEPLIRMPATTSDPNRRLKDSLGLGLFIAREIVRGHGGTITVQSSRERETAFTIRLPRAGIE